jgi:hypothetical protein
MQIMQLLIVLHSGATGFGWCWTDETPQGSLEGLKKGDLEGWVHLSIGGTPDTAPLLISFTN